MRARYGMHAQRATHPTWEAQPVELEFIRRAADRETEVLREVRTLAERLSQAWSSQAVSKAITTAHVHGAKSDAISLIFAEQLLASGFTSEKKGLFSAMQCRAYGPIGMRR
jgi:hypothetical protein